MRKVIREETLSRITAYRRAITAAEMEFTRLAQRRRYPVASCGRTSTGVPWVARKATADRHPFCIRAVCEEARISRPRLRCPRSIDASCGEGRLLEG